MGGLDDTLVGIQLGDRSAIEGKGEGNNDELDIEFFPSDITIVSLVDTGDVSISS